MGNMGCAALAPWTPEQDAPARLHNSGLNLWAFGCQAGRSDAPLRPPQHRETRCWVGVWKEVMLFTAMDLVNNLQQLLYTQGLLVFPARCLQTGSIWPYLHGAVHNLINQPQSASFAFPKHSPRDDPDLVGLASVPRGGRSCL